MAARPYKDTPSVDVYERGLEAVKRGDRETCEACLDELRRHRRTPAARDWTDQLMDKAASLLRGGRREERRSDPEPPAPKPAAPIEEFLPVPTPASRAERCIEHDGLHFRSPVEIKVYEALKKRRVLFFTNAMAVLGGKDDNDPLKPFKNKREPDFLVCQDGKWGILEVMGQTYHPAATAMRDHERARRFDDYGIRCIHFYHASECTADAGKVVDDFLTRLARG